MRITTSFFNNTSVKHLSQLQTEQYVQDLLTLPSQTNSLVADDLVMKDDFYQRLRSLPSTIISLQYDPDEFLTFKVYKAEQGQIVSYGTEAIGLQCRIGGKTYTFNLEHLNQMSNSERRDLFNHLGVDSSKFF